MRFFLQFALLVLHASASASTFTISSAGINSIGMLGPEGELLTEKETVSGTFLIPGIFSSPIEDFP